MRWPWERSKQEREKEVDETEVVKQRLKLAINELRKSLDLAEKQMRTGIENGH
jgi:hypothetical protein